MRLMIDYFSSQTTRVVQLAAVQQGAGACTPWIWALRAVCAAMVVFGTPAMLLWCMRSAARRHWRSCSPFKPSNQCLGRTATTCVFQASGNAALGLLCPPGRCIQPLSFQLFYRLAAKWSFLQAHTSLRPEPLPPMCRLGYVSCAVLSLSSRSCSLQSIIMPPWCTAPLHRPGC